MSPASWLYSFSRSAMPPTVSRRPNSCVSTARRARCSSASLGGVAASEASSSSTAAWISSSVWPGRATTSIENTEPSAWPYCDAVTD